MKMFAKCAGKCHLCANRGHCLAGAGDDDFEPASMDQLEDNLTKVATAKEHNEIRNEIIKRRMIEYAKTPMVLNQLKEPPLGLMHRKEHDLKRMQAIDEAIRRYTERRMVIPLEWVEEYNQLRAAVNGKEHFGDVNKMDAMDPWLYVTTEQLEALRCDVMFEHIGMYSKDYPLIDGEVGRMRTNKGHVRFVLQD